MQPTTSDQALSQLQQYQGSLQTPQQALDAAKTGLGVNQAQQTAGGLQTAIQNTSNLLNQVAPSVYGRTGNSLVTSAQASQQINNAQAPLNAQLNKQNTDYANAEKNYEDLMGQAEDEAKDTLTGQDTKLSGLQSIYNDLYGKEKDAAASAEQQREFNADLAEKQAEARAAGSSSDGLSSVLGSLLGGNSSSSGPSASYQQRADKGFNFQAPNGSGISAAQYAQLTGTPLRTLLQQMANEGDNGAKTALNYVGNDYGINAAKVGNNQQVKNILNSILGGINKI